MASIWERIGNGVIQLGMQLSASGVHAGGNSAMLPHQGAALTMKQNEDGTFTESLSNEEVEKNIEENKHAAKDGAIASATGIALGLLSTSAGATLLNATTPGFWLSKAGAPLLGMTADAGLAGYGVISAAPSIIEDVKDGNYLKAGFKTAINIPALYDIVKVGKLLRPAYRRYHSYHAITPWGYDDPLGRVRRWTSSMLENKHYTPKTEQQLTDELEDYLLHSNYVQRNGVKISDEEAAQLQRYIKDISDPELRRILQKDIELQKQGIHGFAKARQYQSPLARDDAWRQYLGYEQRWNTYSKNPDGTFSYTFDPSTLSPYSGRYSDRREFGRLAEGHVDFVTGAGGNTAPHNVQILDNSPWRTNPSAQNIDSPSFGDLYEKDGVVHVEDVWDLQPFSRMNILDKFPTLKSITPQSWQSTINKAAKKFEVGPLLGGKPFTLKTDVPVKVTFNPNTPNTFGSISLRM